MIRLADHPLIAEWLAAAVAVGCDIESPKGTRMQGWTIYPTGISHPWIPDGELMSILFSPCLPFWVQWRQQGEVAEVFYSLGQGQPSELKAKCPIGNRLVMNCIAPDWMVVVYCRRKIHVHGGKRDPLRPLGGDLGPLDPVRMAKAEKGFRFSLEIYRRMLDAFKIKTPGLFAELEEKAAAGPLLRGDGRYLKNI